MALASDERGTAKSEATIVDQESVGRETRSSRFPKVMTVIIESVDMQLLIPRNAAYELTMQTIYLRDLIKDSHCTRYSAILVIIIKAGLLQFGDLIKDTNRTRNCNGFIALIDVIGFKFRNLIKDTDCLFLV